jgi:hypothetical protein
MVAFDENSSLAVGYVSFPAEKITLMEHFHLTHFPACNYSEGTS